MGRLSPKSSILDVYPGGVGRITGPLICLGNWRYPLSQSHATQVPIGNLPLAFSPTWGLELKLLIGRCNYFEYGFTTLSL